MLLGVLQKTTIQDPSGFVVSTNGVLWVAAAIILLLGCIAAIWRALKPIVILMQRTTDFLDDWQGTPARPGVPARQGVMVRLSTVETNKVDRDEFQKLAAEVAEKATGEELEQLRAMLVYASDLDPHRITGAHGGAASP